MVITDWHLGEETAEALIASCREHRPELPIVCVSGSMAGGGLSVPIIGKPFAPETLLAMVRTHHPRRRG